MTFRRCCCTIALLIGPLVAGANSTTSPSSLPAQTSCYNRGDSPGRFRDADGKLRKFKLKREVSIYDGGGRAIGAVRDPVMLNVGAVKQLAVQGGDGKKQTYLWAWDTPAGSGWVLRDALIDPPPAELDRSRDPKPPRESNAALTIDAAAGTAKLKGLRHVNSAGVIPPGGGNRGDHYAGRNPGPNDYVYLLFACPNVQRGGTARDSLPDGGKFIAALDENAKPITETMTMYRDGDMKQPVKVTFIYGREEGGDFYGWIARANVGEL